MGSWGLRKKWIFRRKSQEIKEVRIVFGVADSRTFSLLPDERRLFSPLPLPLPSPYFTRAAGPPDHDDENSLFYHRNGARRRPAPRLASQCRHHDGYDLFHLFAVELQGGIGQSPAAGNL
jgi:hypothetical protein